MVGKRKDRGEERNDRGRTDAGRVGTNNGAFDELTMACSTLVCLKDVGVAMEAGNGVATERVRTVDDRRNID